MAYTGTGVKPENTLMEEELKKAANICDRPDCLYCKLTEEQKQKYRRDVRAKTTTNRKKYGPWESIIGAKADAIFAAHFDLPIDVKQYLRGDSWDFIVGNHTIDVKGTPRRVPNLVQYLRSDCTNNMVYVFIRVAMNNDHARFQGYAIDRATGFTTQTGAKQAIRPESGNMG